jgi:hypothetical protein
MVNFETPPRSGTDKAGGYRTPEEGIAAIIQKQPAFTASERTEYVGNPPDIVQADPDQLSDYDLSGHFSVPGQSRDLVVEVRDRADNQVQVTIQNICVQVKYEGNPDDGIKTVVFNSTITVPKEALDDGLWTTNSHSWEVERISTE